MIYQINLEDGWLIIVDGVNIILKERNILTSYLKLEIILQKRLIVVVAAPDPSSVIATLSVTSNACHPFEGSSNPPNVLFSSFITLLLPVGS